MPSVPARPRSTLLAILALWALFYSSFVLFTPPLLDDADSVHSEVAREMLLRHDYVTLYANGIRYLEKAPLMYWSMAASMKLSQLVGATGPRALAAAARFPIALDVLGLVLFAEILARRLFRSRQAGLYAALILLSSPGIFLFSRLTLPDVGLCLWTTWALLCFWLTEELPPADKLPPWQPPSPLSPWRDRAGAEISPYERKLRLYCGGFAAACALNVLTKGLIGVVFPLAITILYLLMTRGVRGTLRRLRELHPLATCEAFLLIAAPWHILAGLANPTQGHPALFHFVHGHWQVPLPTDGNVRGWFWFYFMNEHVLRYLNLRVPHDYDTSPLWLFWGLCLVWIMPWSAFLFNAAYYLRTVFTSSVRGLMHFGEQRGLSAQSLRILIAGPRESLFLSLWAAFVLLFFSLSTRQEYYVLPALPALAILIAGWLTLDVSGGWKPVVANPKALHRKKLVVTVILLALGALFAVATAIFLLHSKAPSPDIDLASLLQQNPGDYALSMGHFLDLNAQALGLFRVPLLIAVVSLFFGPLLSIFFLRKDRPHPANLALAAGAVGFLLAAHLGLRTFSPVLTSAQLAQAIAPQVKPADLIVIHGEYEAGSTLGFYLQRPESENYLPNDAQFIHILEGRSSNLWYGSFFPDAPAIFETPASLASKWSGPQRIFLWQSLTDPPNQLPLLPGPVYVLARSGGKEIISNQLDR